MNRREALVLVDIQNDFLPGGALAVSHGDEVIEIANRLSPHFACVIATQDFHPANHKSFASQHPGKKPGDVVDLDGISQVLWPDHCVQGTRGAELAATFRLGHVQKIFTKGMDPRVDSYSGFFDNARRGDTGLDAFLKQQNISTLYLLGLATDYCVKFTALDARDLGYEVHLVVDGCRGVGLSPQDIPEALEQMQSAGVVLETSAQVLSRL